MTGCESRVSRWRSARLAIAGIRACAVVGVVNALLVGAQDQFRATVVTHDNPDVYPLWLLYGLVELVAPVDTTLTVTGWLWLITVLATAVAFVGWLVRARRQAGRSARWPLGWAIGGWLVPVANLVIPYLVVRDVDRAGAAAAGARPAPVGRWWLALVATMALDLTGVLPRAGYRMGVPEAVGPAVTYLLWVVATTVVGYASVTGVRVVRRVTEALQAA